MEWGEKIIRKNHTTGYPRRFVLFDCETTQTPINDRETAQTLKLGWCAFLELAHAKHSESVEWFEFRTVKEFWDRVCSSIRPKQPVYMASHNLNFDFAVLDGASQLEQRGWTMKFVYLKGFTVLMTFRSGQKTIKLFSTTNWFHSPLSELGKVVGLDKLEVDFSTTDDTDLSIYCRRDVEILVRLVKEYLAFCAEHDCGKLKLTAASQSFAAYRHRFMHTKIYTHDNQAARSMERAAYHGGRSSVFYVGALDGDTYYKLDINSAYPNVMVNEFMPTRLIAVLDNVDIARLKTLIEKYCLIADLSLASDLNPYPVNMGGFNIYPVGQFRTVLSTPEIRYALEHGHVIEVHKVAVYTRAKIFSEYVDYFYRLKDRYKKENNRPGYTMVKLFLNSLYGKFGQRATRFLLADDYVDEYPSSGHIRDCSTGKIYTVYRIGKHLYIESECEDEGESMPAIAAHITAAQRIYLFNLMSTAGRGNVFYCDTDSVVVNSIGMENLKGEIDPNALGKLKVEETDSNPKFVAAKTYRFNGKWVRKGIPRKAVERGNNVFEFTLFPSLRGLYLNGKDGPYTTRTITRTLTLKIHDGTVNPDGTVSPIRLQ